MGEILGVRVDRIDSGNRAVVLLGLLLVLLALATIVVYGIRRDLTGGSPIGVALICVGLLFDAATTEGRYFGGYLSAGASRYTTFDLLVPIGIYLAWLGRPTLAWGHRRQDRRLDTEARGAQSGDRAGGGIPGWVTVAVRGVIGVVILVQIPFGINAGIAGARYRYAGELVAVRVEHHIDRASVGQIDQLYIFQSTAFIRQQVRTAEKYHLSAFTGGTGG